MILFADLLVFLGIVFLGLGLKPAVQICQKTHEIGWQILLTLIIAFMIGYSLFLFYLLSIRTITFVELGMSAILFGGSLFVALVVNYSLKSIGKIDDIAQLERYNAMHDSLTQLPNRHYCMQQLDKRIERRTPFSVLLFDVNNFKYVNDAMGHQFGDMLLRQISQRLSMILPKQAFFSRIGGDEFVVILRTGGRRPIEELYTVITEELSHPFNLGEYSIIASISTGVSIYPEYSTEKGQILKQADVAMYEAKNSGCGLYFYSSDLADKAKEQLDISSQLTSALHNQEFELHYQPIVNTRYNSLYGYEALIRWPQANGTFISPEVFIPIAEQSHIIRDITDWVVNQVILDMQLFHESGIDASIHLNLSAKDLNSRALFNNLEQLVKSDQLNANRLVLEVTESNMLKDLKNTKQVLQALREIGFKISLDDFGTGYSSLTLLRELPIDQIKIDKSFVSGMHRSEADHAIVKSSISLAHGLNCTVIAEGVEETELMVLLDTANCDYVQGFINGRAQTLEDIIFWTKQHQLKSAI
ncbi:putative bifunctional diguanylate cyclase/phosphodiesterase [Vibrio nigripulchritudo]|uniref:putative bifunctional diguanylate cyclase/phosphodiesterase n=1 Tax=Vibrio nigripulchritudo TaxID=28173 RepID=UPI0003B1B958|nr:EAL domain-containing protein [Vibrio nigripulchritudo]CCN72751.1 putative EAL and GGDEF domains protein [Vibrio nigripulchritudo SFn118]